MNQAFTDPRKRQETRKYAVRLDAVANEEPRLVQEALPGFAHLKDWRSAPLIDSARRFAGVVVVGRQVDPAVLRLRVFSWPGTQDSAVRKVTTTLVNINEYEPYALPDGTRAEGAEGIGGFGIFRFARLSSPGKYSYTVSDEDGPVAGGIVQSPCPVRWVRKDQPTGTLGNSTPSFCVPKLSLRGRIDDQP